MISDSDNIKLLIVEDCEAAATGLEVSFKHLSDIEVIAVVADGIEARDFLMETTHNVDIVLMDIAIQSDSESGIKHTKQLKWRYPELRFIAYSAFGDKSVVEKFFDAGGVGFLDKIDSLPEIIKAIKCVYKGERYMSKSVREYFGSLMTQPEKKSKSKLLTSKQLQVLQLRADGLTNKEVARYLYVSEETVKSHTKNIIAKLEATNMTNAIFIAVKKELI